MHIFKVLFRLPLEEKKKSKRSRSVSFTFFACFPQLAAFTNQPHHQEYVLVKVEVDMMCLLMGIMPSNTNT